MRIGTAGWSLNREVAPQFGDGDSQLARYATRLDAVEINSCFYRPHRPATYARWAESVPEEFRFALKLPRAITHEARLQDVDEPLAAFLAQSAPLGPKRGPILVQTPPSLGFSATIASAFLDRLRECWDGPVACEPRHAGWFIDEADALLDRFRVARVAADPALSPTAARPGGWPGFRYHRLHGSLALYRTPYGLTRLMELAGDLDRGPEDWVVFDNTADGAAVPDALALAALLAGS